MFPFIPVSPWESTQIQEVYYLDNMEQINKVSAPIPPVPQKEND